MTTALTRIVKIGAIAVVSAVALGACSHSSVDLSKEKRPCPNVSILGDASTVTAFRQGGGHDLTDVIYEGAFTSYAGVCQYDVDKDTGKGKLDVELRLNMTASRGPANTTHKAPLTYFVSVTDLHDNTLQRATYDVVADFPGNRTQALIEKQPIYITLPIHKGISGADYRVYMGFQLTRDQLDYNRSNH